MRSLSQMRICLFISLMFFSSSFFAQEDYVTELEHDCVYMNYEQFHTNTGWLLTADPGDSKHYSVIDNKGKGEVIHQRNLWGKRVNGINYIQIDKVFSLIQKQECFMHIAHKPRARVSSISGGSVSIRVQPSTGMEHYILERETGDLHRLSRNYLRSILAISPELHESYNRERSKDLELNLIYLNKLNDYCVQAANIEPKD